MQIQFGAVHLSIGWIGLLIQIEPLKIDVFPFSSPLRSFTVVKFYSTLSDGIIAHISCIQLFFEG